MCRILFLFLLSLDLIYSQNCYIQGTCNAGYMDRTNGDCTFRQSVGNCLWQACVNNDCVGGANYSYQNCECACIPEGACGSIYVYKQIENYACSSNYILGYNFSTPKECAQIALETQNCTTYQIMWSDSYNSGWGCRCCTIHSSINEENQYWDIYAYTIITSEPTLIPTINPSDTTDNPTRNPSNNPTINPTPNDQEIIATTETYNSNSTQYNTVTNAEGSNLNILFMNEFIFVIVLFIIIVILICIIIYIIWLIKKKKNNNNNNNVISPSLNQIPNQPIKMRKIESLSNMNNNNNDDHEIKIVCNGLDNMNVTKGFKGIEDLINIQSTPIITPNQLINSNDMNDHDDDNDYDDLYNKGDETTQTNDVNDNMNTTVGT